MKSCPFCREEIRDDALKCRYCQTMLIPVEPRPAPDRNVTYVLDKDLVRFLKFSGAILSIIVVVGVLFYGVDLKKIGEDTKKAAEETKKAASDTRDLQKDISQARDRITQEAKAVEAAAQDIRSKQELASREYTIIHEQQADLVSSRDRVRTIVDGILVERLEVIFTPKQLASLRDRPALRRSAAVDTDTVLRSANADLKRALDYFRQHGLQTSGPIVVRIDKDLTLANVYYDGAAHAIVFGMGMVNSDIFGPYDSALVLHEATHAVFDLAFIGESGAISESIADVIAVVVRGEGWTVGRVRGTDPSKPQFVRSLSAPGHAFDNPDLGKDPQPDHMEGLYRGPQDNGGVHINVGIPNKAAYLIAEGGQHHGVAVPKGIGRERLGNLYVAVIKKLPAKGTLSFRAFRDLVVTTAADVLADRVDKDVVRLAFQAVGL